MSTDQIAIKSRKYALKALKDQRVAIASEIVQIKRQWNVRRQQLIHVDATIQLLQAGATAVPTPPKGSPEPQQAPQ